MSRESPATLYAVEDEVEKAFIRKKSFFNKKASKSSILTVRKVMFLFISIFDSFEIVRMMAMKEIHQWHEQVQVLMKLE